MTNQQFNIMGLPLELVYNILKMSNEYDFILKNNKIMILTKPDIYIIDKLNKLCEYTDYNCLKSWGNFNKICMTELYRKCNYITFRNVINHINANYQNFVSNFIDFILDVNTLHYVTLIYYNLFKKIYNTPINDKIILTNTEKNNFYSLFLDFCNFYYFQNKNKINVINNNLYQITIL
jgi:hypothetical protein